MKILIVGAGFSGSVIAHELANAGNQIDLIDQREHIGGNAFDYVNSHGIRIHKYGPHLFHTNDQRVFDWLSQFTAWVPYKHKVKALLKDGRFVTLPVNQETKQLVGEENILDIFFRPYTRKMWGKELEELDPSIINRIPIRDDDNEYYFPNDEFQFMPEMGYTKIFEEILNVDGINIKLNTSFNKEMESQYDFVFNSMPIDEYFDYHHGKLPYRSIKFHTVDIPAPMILPTACVNFTHEGPYTRITEWKHIPNCPEYNEEFTTLTYEEPCDYEENNMERYYPVKDVNGSNREIYKTYREMTPKNMQFIGRCGMYVYVDMHQAISSSLATAKKFLNSHSG